MADDLFGKPDRNEKGQFVPNNKFWRIAVLKAGRPRQFESPESMYQAAMDYFDWVANNPLKEHKAFGTGMEKQVDKMRPMSVRGLCVHLGFTTTTFYKYRDDREEFAEIIQHIQDVMATYNYEGAVSGLMNANIIARELGLSERVTHGNDPNNPMPSGVGPTIIYELPDNGRD